MLLNRLTANRKHRDLAAHIINERGRQRHYCAAQVLARGDDPKTEWAWTYDYNQPHKPVREQTVVVSHAVRAM